MNTAPTSQLAWLSSLKTSFNDFTDEQKFLRKVSGSSPIER
jgi:pyruvate kinase